MKSSWDLEKGHLTCRWFEVGNRVQYDSAWMRESVDVRGSYLPPLPDFASHSPFGAPSGFQSYFTRQNS
jgi:hypothetical protein